MLELDTERLEQLAKDPEATADASDQGEVVLVAQTRHSAWITYRQKLDEDEEDSEFVSAVDDVIAGLDTFVRCENRRAELRRKYAAVMQKYEESPQQQRWP